MKPTVIVYWSDESPNPEKLYSAVIGVHASEKRPDRMHSFFVTHDAEAAAEVLKQTRENDKRKSCGNSLAISANSNILTSVT